MEHPAITYTKNYRKFGTVYIKAEDRHSCVFLDTKTGKTVVWEYSQASSRLGFKSVNKYLCWLRYRDDKGKPVPSKNFPYLLSVDCLFQGSRDPRDWALLQDQLLRAQGDSPCQTQQ